MRFVEVVHPTQGLTTVPETAVSHMAAKGWKLATDKDKLFDPAKHTAEEVETHLDYASPEERDRVVALEDAE